MGRTVTIPFQSMRNSSPPGAERSTVTARRRMADHDVLPTVTVTVPLVEKRVPVSVNMTLWSGVMPGGLTEIMRGRAVFGVHREGTHNPWDRCQAYV